MPLEQLQTAAYLSCPPPPPRAQVLGELVEKSGYSPQAAAELHKQLYRQKLMGLVAKKKLSEEEQVRGCDLAWCLCPCPNFLAAATW
jgi:hypothetical protein